MVRIVLSSLLTLALSFSVAHADDTISANQLESLASATAALPDGGTASVTLTIGGVDVVYTVTKDALGNITATGPLNAQIQTIAISTGASGSASNVPLAVTIITAQGGISSFNISTNASGQITGVTSTDALTGNKTTTTLSNQTLQTSTAGGTVTTDTFTTSTAGGGGTTTGTVIITFAPGTSPATLTLVSPH